MRRLLIACGALLCSGLLVACSGDDNAVPADASTMDVVSTTDAQPADAALQPPYTLTGDAIQGWQFVQQRQCPMCHQPADPTLGFMSGQDTPQPGTMSYGTNLTPDPDTGMDGWDAPTVARALRQGLDDQGQYICPPMPRFTDMSDEEAIAIAAFLSSLPAVHHDIPDSVCAIPDAGSDASAGCLGSGWPGPACRPRGRRWAGRGSRSRRSGGRPPGNRGRRGRAWPSRRRRRRSRGIRWPGILLGAKDVDVAETSSLRRLDPGAQEPAVMGLGLGLLDRRGGCSRSRRPSAPELLPASSLSCHALTGSGGWRISSISASARLRAVASDS